jgi:hypothetical protein
MSVSITFLYFVTAVSAGIILGHIIYEGVQMVTDIVDEFVGR